MDPTEQRIKEIIQNGTSKYKNMGGESRVKIICYRGDRSSCWAQRIHFPFSYLAKNNLEDYFIHITSKLELDQVGQFKIAIFQRQYKAEVFEVMRVMHKFGMKTVFEIDDDVFGVPKWNPAYAVYGKRAVRENVKYFLSNVDAIFTTNDYLAGVYAPYCESVYVLPNSIDPNVIYPSPRNSAKKVICWQGSYTHDKDVKLIKPALEKLVKDNDVFLKMWSFDFPGAYTVPMVPFESFYPMFAQIDGYIGLAPITSVPFNKSKSNLKFLEYTAQGMATIASNFGPYAETIEHEKTGLLVSNNKEWYDAIRYLIDNEDVHAELVKNAREFVFEHYNMEKNYKLWQNAIEAIIGEHNEKE